jgi:hypothetical protein
LDGIEEELGSSAPAETRVALNAFRVRLRVARSAQRRKDFEEELESLLQNEPSLRAATEQYLCKRIPQAIDTALAALKMALPYLASDGQEKRS